MKRNSTMVLVLVLGVSIALGFLRSKAGPMGLGFSPEIVTFTATPEVANPGQPVTLAWNARGAAALTMQWGPENHTPATAQQKTDLPPVGTMTVQPAEDTVYELRCETVAGPMCLPAAAAVHMK